VKIFKLNNEDLLTINSNVEYYINSFFFFCAKCIEAPHILIQRLKLWLRDPSPSLSKCSGLDICIAFCYCMTQKKCRQWGQKYIW
jgi:hypothetical protein